MKYLPYENFCITTLLSPVEVKECLSQEVEPMDGFNFRNLFYRTSPYYFSGEFINNLFELEPIVNYRYNFSPQITGTITPYLQGSQVQIKMRLVPLNFVFLFIWFGFTTIMGIVVLYQIFNTGNFSMVILGTPLLAYLGYILTIGQFKRECIAAKSKLAHILVGEITEN